MSVIGPQPKQIIKNVTTAGTAEPLVATSKIAHSVTVQAKSGNTGSIYIGDADVDNTSLELIQGATIPLPDNTDLSNWYIDAASSGDGVIILYTNGN